MKDLDLDELHHAVSAIMDDPGAKAKKKGKPLATKADNPRPVVKKDTPAVNVPQRNASPDDGGEAQRIEVKRPAPRLNIPPRRRGSAMDIVQPAKPTPAPARPSRVAPMLQPTQQAVVPEPPQPIATPPTPSLASPIQTTAAPKAQPSQASEEPALPELHDDLLASLDLQQDTSKPVPTLIDKSEPESWPDPLDFHKLEEEPPALSTSMPTIEAPTLSSGLAEQSPATTPLADDTDSTPTPAAPEDFTATPFVKTKVEKRPLGAFATEVTQPKPEPVSQLSAAQSAAEMPVSDPELEPSAEASMRGSELPSMSSPSAAAPEPSSTPDLNTARQMAIPPQYQQTSKEPDAATRPVFDTAEYHTPLIPEHVPHHGGTKGWIIITILLVLVVAGALLAYFVLTGSLDITQFL